MTERVRVTGPARRRATTTHRSGTREIDAGTELGRVYMESLLREQLRLALRILGLLAVTVGILPLAFHLIPGLAEVRVGPLPLSWLLLGVLVYPWLLTSAGSTSAGRRPTSATSRPWSKRSTGEPP